MKIPLASMVAWGIGTFTYILLSAVSLLLPTSSVVYRSLMMPHNIKFLYWHFYIALFPFIYNIFTYGVLINMILRLCAIPQKNFAAVIGLSTGYGSAFCMIQTLFWILTKRTHLSVLLGSVNYETGLTFHTGFGHLAVILGFIHAYFEVRKQMPHVHVGNVTITGCIASKLFFLSSFPLVFFFLIGYLPALRCFRERYYELFRFLHLFMILGTAFIILHLFIHPRATFETQKVFGLAMILVFVAFFIDRSITIIRSHFFSLKIIGAKWHKTKTKDGEKYHILLTLKCNSTKEVVSPGNWVSLTIPCIGPIPHPFSVFSIPENMQLYRKKQNKDLKFNVFCLLIGVFAPRKMYVPWTSRLAKLVVANKLNKYAFMTGPYGSLRVPELIESADKLLVICGGTGISTCLANLAYIQCDKLLKFYWTFREPIMYVWVKDYFLEIPKNKLVMYCTHKFDENDTNYNIDNFKLDGVNLSRMNVKEIINESCEEIKDMYHDYDKLQKIPSEIMCTENDAVSDKINNSKSRIKLYILAAVPKLFEKQISESILEVKSKYNKFIQITYEPQVYSF